MTEIRITWHSYRYFPYERELAKREASAILGLDKFVEHKDGFIVPTDTSIEGVRRLTYFAGLRNGRDLVATTQSQLECASLNGHKRQATRYSVHGLHEYKGKFNPQVAKALMNMFGLSRGSRVLDPFCGSGTTLIEAAQMGADAVGTDLNPFAVFLANAKQLALKTPASELNVALCRLSQQLEIRRSRKSDPIETSQRLAYLEEWFDPLQLAEIEHVRSVINNSCGITAPVFLAIASDMLREYSLQDPVDLRIRRRKTPLPSTIFRDAFLLKAKSIFDRIANAQSILPSDIGEAQATLLNNAQLRVRSFGKKFDCAITSPPYAMALPYIDTQRLSIVWLGLSDPDAIMRLESSLTGSREMRGGTKKSLLDALAENSDNLPIAEWKFCRRLASALNTGDGFRRQAVPSLLYRYFSSMRQSFAGIKKVMKRDAPFALVVGHNHTTLGGKRFDINTPQHLSSLALSAGWSVDEMIPLQTYQRYGYHAGNAIDAETLILLRNA